MPKASTQVPTYEYRVLSAYEGEVLGEEFFDFLAKNAGDEAVRFKLQKLAKLEQVVGQAFSELIARHQLRPKDPELLRVRGRKEALEFVQLSWTDFAGKLEELLLPFLSEYETMLADAPMSDKPYMQLLVDHEAALVAFARDEGTQAADGLVHLERFSERHSNLLRKPL